MTSVSWMFICTSAFCIRCTQLACSMSSTSRWRTMARTTHTSSAGRQAARRKPRLMSFCSHWQSCTSLLRPGNTSSAGHRPARPSGRAARILQTAGSRHAGGLQRHGVHAACEQPVGHGIEVVGHRAEFTYELLSRVSRYGHPVDRCAHINATAWANTSSSCLRPAMASSTMVDERQRHGRRRIRLDLMNGMRIAGLTTVADESRTMLVSGLAYISRQCQVGHLGAVVHFLV
jgi:hypothetical protein